MTSNDQRRGFTLVEVLVAASLAVVLVGGALAVLSSSTQVARRAEVQRQAVQLAEAVLSGPLRDGQTGRRGDLTWRVSLSDSGFDPGVRTGDGFAIRAARVQVSGPGMARPVTLWTERVMR